MDWTDETIARLRVLWDEGHSTAEIGRRLGISKNAVVGKAHRLTLPPRPSPIRRAEGAPVPRRVAVAPRGPDVDAGPSPVPQRPATVPQPAAAVTPPVRIVRPRPVLQAVPTAPRTGPRAAPCCWPIGEPGTSGFHFCGADAMTGKPYCAQHAQIAYVKVRDRREDAA